MHIYQKYLKNELERRKLKNQLYSLRAFSRDLGVPSSKLSQYIKGGCGLSGTKASVLAKNLNLSHIETEIFILSAEAAHARDKTSKEVAQQKLQKLTTSPEIFLDYKSESISLFEDWTNFIILVMTELEDFKSDTTWIAKELDLNESQVKKSVEQLCKFGYLDCSEKKWYRKKTNFIHQNDNQCSNVMIRYHEQVNNYISSKISSNSTDVSTALLAINEDQIEAYNNIIENFRSEMISLSKKTECKKSIYLFNLAFLPVYKKNTNFY